MTPKPAKFDGVPSPAVVLFKLLANSLLEDKYGINMTAYNALMILAAVIDKNMAADIKKKVIESRNRYRYEN
jgi:hypothetical protein